MFMILAFLLLRVVKDEFKHVLNTSRNACTAKAVSHS